MTFEPCASVNLPVLRFSRVLVRFSSSSQQLDFAKSPCRQRFQPRLGLFHYLSALPRTCAAQLVPPCIGRTTEAHRKFFINKSIKFGFNGYIISEMSGKSVAIHTLN